MQAGIYLLIFTLVVFFNISTAEQPNPCQGDMNNVLEMFGKPQNTDEFLTGDGTENFILWEYPDRGFKRYFRWGGGYDFCTATEEQMPLSKKGIDREVKELKKEHPKWSINVCRAIVERKVVIGMNTEQVIESWGAPRRINKTIGVNGRLEQWIYGDQILNFINGKLTLIQEQGK